MVAIANAKQWTVNVSYYGNTEFSVSHTDWSGFNALTDTVTYKVDGPGTLFLQDDAGRIYYSRSGEVTLTGLEMTAGGKLMRCSLVTPDGELLGWQATHDGAAGGDGPPAGSNNAAAAAVAALPLALLFV